MEIQEIKAQLSILTVLDHYGLKPNKNKMLHCPFHEDKTPSLQIYPQTNTFCCFSSNCTAGTGDVIKFIELKNTCTKYEAIMKAKELLNYIPPIPKASAAEDMSRQAVLIKFYQHSRLSIERSQAAREYAHQRGLSWKKLNIGFNGKSFHESMGKAFKESAFKVGLFRESSPGYYCSSFCDCLIFTLRDKEGHLVSIYARSIINDKERKHFYLQGGHQGLYPSYPKSETRKLILTESVIDAATLYQISEISMEYSIIACYGTNGFTEEHLRAIRDLKALEEVILFFDGDEAGRKGADKIGRKLSHTPGLWKISIVLTPENEDINSLLQSHEPEIFTHLLNGRQPLIFSIEKETPSLSLPEPLPAAPLLSEPPKEPQLNTTNPELLIYNNGSLQITVLGGIKITGLDRLRTTLKIEHPTKTNLLPIRHNLDLYHSQHTEQLITKISELMEVSHQETTKTISHLIAALEQYRNQQITHLTTPKPENKLLSPEEKARCLDYLKSQNLMQKTQDLLGATGIIGEEENRLIMYLTMTSRKRNNPLNIICLGQSGTGKSHLMEKVSECIPEEDIIENTSFSEFSFYYYGKEELRHKIILIEDMDGAENVLYPIRELQSKKRISRTIALKDPKGNIKTVTLRVEGPVCVIGCTTKEKVYEDNANRSILLYVDQSKDQDKQIMNYQKQLSAGYINKSFEKENKQLLQNTQRLLRLIEVRNPYANHIDLPEEAFKPRRTLAILLAFIEAVTFYHQYQCPIKEDPESKEIYIETQPEHIEWTFILLRDILFKKSDELSGGCRNFFEKLKIWMQNNNKDSFYSKEIRTAFRANPNTLKYHLKELNNYSYIKITRGNKYKGFEYQITDPQEYNHLRNSIDQKLTDILKQISYTAQLIQNNRVGNSG